jgi:GTPase SAR1 family protein
MMTNIPGQPNCITMSAVKEMNQIHVVVLGAVSAGKSTFVNALFAKQFSDMHIKRTTALPQIYREADNDEKTDGPDEVRASNRRKNKEIMDFTLKKGNNLTLKDIIPVEYCVPKTHEIFDGTDSKIPDGIKLVVHDMPGLNDSQTKDVYHEYVRANFHKYDVAIMVVDINSSFNTSGEVEILDLIITGIKTNELDFNRHTRLIIMYNKCDEIEEINGRFVPDDVELKEMYEQGETVVAECMQRVFVPNGLAQTVGRFARSFVGIKPNKVLSACVSCEDAFIYRMVEWGNFNALDIKHINKLGVIEHGKKQWKAMTKTESNQKEARTKLVNDIRSRSAEDKPNHQTDMASTGWESLRKVLASVMTLSCQRQYLDNRVKAVLATIGDPTEIPKLKQFYVIRKGLKSIHKMYHPDTQFDDAIHLHKLYSSKLTDHLIKFKNAYGKQIYAPIESNYVASIVKNIRAVWEITLLEFSDVVDPNIGSSQIIQANKVINVWLIQNMKMVYEREDALVVYLAQIKRNCVDDDEFDTILIELLTNLGKYQFAACDHRLASCFQIICQKYQLPDAKQVKILMHLVMETLSTKKEPIYYWLDLVEMCDQTEFTGSRRIVVWIREYARSVSHLLLDNASPDGLIGEPNYNRFPLVSALFALKL